MVPKRYGMRAANTSLQGHLPIQELKGGVVEVDLGRRGLRPIDAVVVATLIPDNSTLEVLMYVFHESRLLLIHLCIKIEQKQLWA